jgi:hypothetical protein
VTLVNWVIIFHFPIFDFLFSHALFRVGEHRGVPRMLMA